MLRRLRPVRLILLALLLAPLTTVLVAWWCAIFVSLSTGNPAGRLDVVVTESSLPNVEWRYGIWSRPGATRVRLGAVRRPGVTLEEAGGYPETPDAVPARVPIFRPGWPGARTERVEGSTVSMPRVQEARGWPWLAMSSEHFLHADWNEDIQDAVWHVRAYRGVVVDPPNSGEIPPDPVILPLGIYWPGFRNCTILYAALWLVLLYGVASVFALRAYWRRRRGRCPKCAYELGDGSSCPECGWGTAA